MLAHAYPHRHFLFRQAEEKAQRAQPRMPHPESLGEIGVVVCIGYCAAPALPNCCDGRHCLEFLSSTDTVRAGRSGCQRSGCNTIARLESCPVGRSVGRCPLQEDMAEDNGRWMTFAELAAARGISRASASRLVRRRKWRRQTENQGSVRILVPTEDNEPADSLSDVVRTFREQLEQANSRADRAETRADGERSRADQAWALAQQYVAEFASERADAKRGHRTICPKLHAKLKAQ